MCRPSVTFGVIGLINEIKGIILGIQVLKMLDEGHPEKKYSIASGVPADFLHKKSPTCVSGIFAPHGTLILGINLRFRFLSGRLRKRGCLLSGFRRGHRIPSARLRTELLP